MYLIQAESKLSHSRHVSVHTFDAYPLQEPIYGSISHVWHTISSNPKHFYLPLSTGKDAKWPWMPRVKEDNQENICRWASKDYTRPSSQMLYPNKPTYTIMRAVATPHPNQTHTRTISHQHRPLSCQRMRHDVLTSFSLWEFFSLPNKAWNMWSVLAMADFKPWQHSSPGNTQCC